MLEAWAMIAVYTTRESAFGQDSIIAKYGQQAIKANTLNQGYA